MATNDAHPVVGTEERARVFDALDRKPRVDQPARVEHGSFQVAGSLFSVRSTTSDPTTLRVQVLSPDAWVLVVTGFRTPDLAATWIGDWASNCATWRWFFLQQVFRTYYGCNVNDDLAVSAPLAGVR